MKILTQIVIIATALIWVSFDVWTYVNYGNVTTISAVFWRYSWHMPGIPFLIGMLAGHLFFQMHEPTAYPDGRN